MNGLPPLPTPGAGRGWSLPDQVYETILTMIVDGRLAENSRLPPEMTLSAQLGVSRPVLRQALKQLREDGVVVSRQGSGSWVRRRPDSAVLSFAPMGSIADIQRTFEFRATVEGDAAALAAARCGREDLARIRAALDTLDRCIAEGALGAEADEDFHVAICAASDNHYYVSARASLKPQILIGMQVARSLSLMRPSARLALVQAEHMRVYDAIAARDADAARSAMRAHVENARARVFEGAAG